MDGAWDIFRIKWPNGTFLALQKKAFGQFFFQNSKITVCLTKTVQLWHAKQNGPYQSSEGLKPFLSNFFPRVFFGEKPFPEFSNAGKVLEMLERFCKLFRKVLKLWEMFYLIEKLRKVLEWQFQSWKEIWKERFQCLPKSIHFTRLYLFKQKGQFSIINCWFD